MIVSLKRIDDRPRALWRYLLVAPEEQIDCRMRDTPLEFFICPQVKTCRLHCLQKLEQRKRDEYVHEQQLKMLIKIEKLSQLNGNNGRKRQ
ncbi:hypothetical protein [[Eubacterium] cellulosolvens]